MSWQELIALIEPHYPKASKKGGRPPNPLMTMLRIHLLLQLYSLSDPSMEEFLIEVPTMRCFAGIELISDRIMVFRDVARGPRSGRSISASTRTPA